MLDAFLATLEPMRAAKARQALVKQVRVNGDALMPRHQLIESRVNAGYIIGMIGGERVLIDEETTTFLDKQNATKTGLDYAAFLIAEMDKEHDASFDAAYLDNVLVQAGLAPPDDDAESAQ